MNRYLKSVASKQFVTWLVVFTAGFVVAVQTLEALGVGTTVTFLAGIISGEIADKVVDHFTDWYLAENEPEVTA